MKKPLFSNKTIKNLNRLLLVFVLQTTFLFAQETVYEDPANFIELSPEVFDKIKNWQLKGADQTTPLDQYLEREGVNPNMRASVNKLFTELRAGNTSGNRDTSCNCAVVTVNSSYDVAPAYTNQFSPPENQGGLTTWYKEQIYGTATRQRLKLNSPTTNNEYEYEKSITGDQVSSNSYSRMSFNYICTNGELLPEDCGCEKNIYLRAKYYNASWVSTSATGGWGTHSCFAAVEDDVALFTIDQHLTDTQVTVLKGAQFQLSRAQDDTWNPEFWMNVVELASAIVGVVEDFDGGIDWSDTVNDVGTQIVDVFQTPIDIHYQEEEDGSANETYTMSYDGGVTLHPNHILTVSMISKGYIYGKGKGKFVSDSEHKSDYFMSAVLPYNDANPECCMEKYAKWVSGSMSAVQSYSSLLNSVSAHVSLWAPWDNLSDTNGDGNLDIPNHIGYAFQADQCDTCGIDPVTGLYVNAGGLDPSSSTTRPVKFYWDGQMFVSYYEVRIYSNTGTLLYTLTTTDTQIIQALPPGDYTFSVRAVCENGEYMDSNLYAFNVKELYADADPIKFTLSPNPGKIDVEINVENYEDFRALKVEVYDTRGTIYYAKELTSSRHKFNVSEWPVGSYFCAITDGQSRTVKQLVKE